MTEPRPERPYMPDYGVEAASWAPLPWSWAADRLTANRNFWVVTVSGEGRPHALPVWGVWDDADARFAFSCGRRARKARNLAANPRALIMTEDTVECLSIEGRASPVLDDGRSGRWIERYLAKYQPISVDVSADFLRQNLMFEFEPERAFAVIEREEDFSTRATRWVFGGHPDVATGGSGDGAGTAQDRPPGSPEAARCRSDDRRGSTLPEQSGPDFPGWEPGPGRHGIPAPGGPRP